MRRGKDGKPLFGLCRNRMPVAHRWAHDIDYAHRLSDEEAEWMSRFMDEYLHQAFKKDGRDLMYIPPEDRTPGCVTRELQNDSNHRRRDLYHEVRDRRRMMASWNTHSDGQGGEYCLDSTYRHSQGDAEDDFLRCLDVKRRLSHPDDVFSRGEDGLQAAEALLRDWGHDDVVETLREAHRACVTLSLEIEIDAGLLFEIDAEQENDG